MGPHGLPLTFVLAKKHRKIVIRSLAVVFPDGVLAGTFTAADNCGTAGQITGTFTAQRTGA